MNSQMMAKMPGISDLKEIDVFRFLFELTREQLDPKTIHNMIIGDEIQKKVRSFALKQMELEKAEAASSSSAMISPVSSTRNSASTPLDLSLCATKNFATKVESIAPERNKEDKDSSDSTTVQNLFYKGEDISKLEAKSHDELKLTSDRSKFINLKAEDASPPPASSSSDSDESIPDSFQLLGRISFSSKMSKWVGSSIYTNMPERAMTEFDKLLRDAHGLKVTVIKQLNDEFPVSYDYNPKKSRIRTNYADPQIADDRTRNNIASRRSRQRKKFQFQMMQYSVDYDKDENNFAQKQLAWLQGMIINMEHHFVSENGEKTAVSLTKLRNLRQQCGLT